MSKLILPELAFWDSMFWPESVPRYLSINQENLYESLVTRWTNINERKPAILTNDETVSFADLRSRTIKLTRLLSRSKVEGLERVLIYATGLNRILASLAAAATSTPIMLSEDRHTLSDVENSLTIDNETVEREIESSHATQYVSEENPNDIFLSLLTQANEEGGSGKIFCQKRAYLSNLLSYNAFLGLTTDSNVIIYPSSDLDSLFHVFACLARGATVMLAEGEAELSTLLYGQNPTRCYLHCKAESLSNPGKGLERILRKNVAWITLFGASDPFGFASLRNLAILGAYELPEIGVVFSNHPTWPVRGSIGIPITNIEARLLKQSALRKSWQEGVIEAGQARELAIGGTTLDGLAYEGNTNRRVVTLRRLAEGKNRWIALKDYAEMDENGIFYIKPYGQKEGIA